MPRRSPFRSAIYFRASSWRWIIAPLSALCVALAGLYLSAGIAAASSDLLGVWVEYSDAGILKMEFFEDGTCHVVGKTASCRWTHLSDGRTKLETGVFGMVRVSFVKVHGDELTIESDGKTGTLVREGSPAEETQKAAAAPIDQSAPELVVAAVFGAARTGHFRQLAKLCDPQGQNDGDTKSICALGRVGADAASSQQPRRGMAPEEFMATFKDARVMGPARIAGARAEVDVVVGVDGKQRPETVGLILRSGKWYLSSL